MKHLLSILALTLLLSSCANKNKAGDNTTADTQVISIDDNQTTVIYFHSNHRCATCMAVENVTREALKENFKDKVPFYSVDITQEKNKALMEKYSIGVQTLMVVKKGQKINLTSEAFMYARSNPEKVKTSIKTTIDSLQ